MLVAEANANRNPTFRFLVNGPGRPTSTTNSAKTLRQVVDHYGDVFFDRVRIAGANIILTEQDRQDIVAFLERF